MSDYARDNAASLAGAISDAITRRLLDVHTSIPGIVEAYDSETQTADVAVAINRFTVAGARVPGPKLPNVPVMWPKTSAGHLAWPLAAGDEVLVVFAERDIDGWRTSGQQSDPLSTRKFSLTDAVCIPGAHSDGNAIQFDSGDEDNLTLYFGGVKVMLTADGTVRVGKQGSSQTEPMVLGSVLVSFLDGIISTLKTVPAGLTTTPGNPVTVSPALIAALDILKGTYIDTPSTNIVSQVAFTERGV